MALLLYPWKSTCTVVVPNCITVGLNDPYLIWKPSLCSSPPSPRANYIPLAHPTLYIYMAFLEDSMCPLLVGGDTEF
jgi:hypothetical protein